MAPESRMLSLRRKHVCVVETPMFSVGQAARVGLYRVLPVAVAFSHDLSILLLSSVSVIFYLGICPQRTLFMEFSLGMDERISR